MNGPLARAVNRINAAVSGVMDAVSGAISAAAYRLIMRYYVRLLRKGGDR